MAKKSSNKIEQFLLPNLYGENKENYSNITDLYDVVPMYYYDKGARANVEKGEASHKVLTRDFVYNKTAYKVKVSPATITDYNGDSLSCYPSAREEVVAEAVKKIIITKANTSVDNKGVIRSEVSVGEIRKELQKRGKSFNWNEIKQAIEVCHKTNVEIILEKDGKRMLASSSIFPSIYKIEEGEDIKSGDYLISFHSLANKAILEGKYRLVSYSQLMNYKKYISRFLHKKIALLYRQAEVSLPYQIKLSTIIRDSGTKQYAQILDNLKEVDRSFQEMKDAKVLEKFTIEKRYEGRRVADALCSLWLSKSFCDDIKKANYFETPLIEEDKYDSIREMIMQTPFNLKKLEVNAIINLVNDTTELDDILAAVEYTKQKIEEGGVQNAQAYLKSAIKNKYRLDSPALFQEEGNDTLEEEGKAYNSDEQEIFDEFMTALKDKVGEGTYNNWFRSINLVSVSPLVLEVKSEFKRQWIEEHLEQQLEETSKAIFNKKGYKLKVVK